MELQIIQHKIHEIRGLKVMLDKDLAELYQVETKNLNRAVKRNIERFPKHFMIQLTEEEVSRCQIGTLKAQGSNIKYLPYAFTEHGVAMLSGVLKSERAIKVSIQIIQAFVEMRHFLIQQSHNLLEIDNLKRRVYYLETITEDTMKQVNDLSEDSRVEFDGIYIALSELASPKNEPKPSNPIGFRT